MEKRATPVALSVVLLLCRRFVVAYAHDFTRNRSRNPAERAAVIHRGMR